MYLAVVAALVGGGYLYFRLDDEIRRHVERTLAGHYQNLQVHVGKARFEQGQGITVYDLAILEPRSHGTPQTLLSIGELSLSGDARIEELMSGRLKLNRIVVRRPRLRAVRETDGRWNVATLLPLPRFSTQSPELIVQDATLVLEDAARANVAPLAIHGIDFKLSPGAPASAGGQRTPPTPSAPSPPRRFNITGTATGAPARELKFSGTIGPDDGTIELTVDVRALEFSPEFLAALPASLPAACQRAQLYGSVDATLRVARSTQGAPLDWSAIVGLSRGRFAHAQLPQPLTELAAKIQADSRRLFVEQLTGKLGAAELVLACERSGWAADAPLALSGRIIGWTIDPHIRASLPAGLQRAWQRFQPAGMVDVETKLTFDGRRWQPDLKVQCRDVALTDAERFAYPLEQATGTVELAPSQVADAMQLRLDLTGLGNGQPVRIAAELDHLLVPTAIDGPDVDADSPTLPKPTGWIEISAGGVAIHERLLAALPTEPDNAQRFVRALDPEGVIDFRWRYERTDPWQPRADTSLDLTLVDCAIQYDAFPYPLEHIHGTVTARNGVWTLSDLEGRDRQGSAVITCQGQSLPEGDGSRLHLVFGGTNLPLDENLRRALSPRVQQAWAELRPQGRLDFTADVGRQPGQLQPEVRVELRPHQQTVSVEPTFFPYRLDQLDGRAIVTAGHVELQQVRARHGHTAFTAHGTWQATPDGGWQLVLNRLNADRLSLEADLLRAMPPGMQKVVDRLRPVGSFDLYDSTLGLQRRTKNAPIASSWDVRVRAHQAALRGDLPLENLTGGVRLLGTCDGPTCYSYGELDVDSLIWNDVQLTSLHGPFWTDSSVCLLGRHATNKLGQPPRRITADVFGGTLAADVQLQHAGQTRYAADVSLGGAALGRIANERFSGPSDLAGVVSGKLSLTGAGRSTYALSGSGELHVVDANIYRLPLLVALLNVLRNRSPDTTAFDRCDMQFDVRGQNIHFHQLNLLGDAVSLYGRGEADFERNVKLVFYTLVGPGELPVPLLKNIVGQISEQTLQVKVNGTLDDPQIHREALPAVNQILQQIRADAQQGASAVTAPAAAAAPWSTPPR